MTPVLIVLNAGSSSLKFQVFETPDGAEPQRRLQRSLRGLGRRGAFRRQGCERNILDETTWSSGRRDRARGGADASHRVAARSIRKGASSSAIGHRVVHGGATFSGPVLVDDTVLQALEALVPLAPLHQPHNLEPIRIVRRRLPGMPQVACFDTAFHQTQSGHREHVRPAARDARARRAALRLPRAVLRLHRVRPEGLRSPSRRGPGDRRASRERREPVRSRERQRASRRPWASPLSTAFRWERAAAPSMPASSSSCCGR